MSNSDRTVGWKTYAMVGIVWALAALWAWLYVKELP